MRFRVSPRLHRLLAICLCGLALASAALVGTGAATSHVAHADGGPTFDIRCGAERHDPSQFSGSFGGYVGPDGFGSQCNGSFSYVLTPTSAYAIWPTDEVNFKGSMPIVFVWVYIPTVNAGAVVDYDATVCPDDSPAGPCRTVQLAHTFNQNAVGGWQNIGVVLLNDFDLLAQVKLSSYAVSHFFMAEDAIGFSDQP